MTENNSTENGSNDTAATAPSELEAKIIRQIEYYFGDQNLVRDKFLLGKIKENDGWVSLEVMVKFPRLAALSTDHDVLTAALKKSTNNLMEVGEGRIRRSVERPLSGDFDEVRNACKERVVYAKGFPLDSKLDDLITFMEKFGKTEHVQMRNDRDRKFKGSVFCTYATEDDAKSFVDAESVKFGETELTRYSREGYFKSKMNERKAEKESAIKARQEKKAKQEQDDEEAFKSRMVKGAVLELKNLPDGVTRENFKEKFGKFGTVAWVDFEKGEELAKLRFSTEDSAKTAWEKALEADGGKVVLMEKELEGRVLEGEEEEEHWRDVIRQQNSGGNRRGGRGGGRGGRGRGGGRGGRGGGHGQSWGGKRRNDENTNGASAAKQSKTEDKPTSSSDKRPHDEGVTAGGDGPSAPKQAKTDTE